MIELEHVTFTYDGADEPALADVCLAIPDGELCLVAGPTGVGKSTLLGAINGLVPHFTGGTLQGRVTVDGRDTRTCRPRELADVVGFVVQDPVRGFVADTVEEELAYGMEQLAIAPAVMRRRVEETLDLLGLADVRDRSLHALSGGQQQRVAIGAVLTAHPRVLVLDEPTSALDPAAAEDVLAALVRLVHDLGLTVVIAEHRLERVVEYADVVLSVGTAGDVRQGSPADQMRTSPVAPPVVRLGRALGWDPLPLSVRDARRRATQLRGELAAASPSRTSRDPGPTTVRVRGLGVRYDRVVALRDVDLDLRGGEVVALMGRNGSGKSTLLWALQGTGARSAGTVAIGTERTDPARLSAAGARRLVGLLPQSASDLLFLSTVAGECAAADEESGRPPGTCRRILASIVEGVDDATHPRDLSEGQRLALALAIQLTADPLVVLLDEPTRGLDEHAKGRLSTMLTDLAAAGRTVVVATHDVEFVATTADRVVVLAAGEIVADGPTADVVVSSPVFAPQIAKVMHPQRWLAVDEVVAATRGRR